MTVEAAEASDRVTRGEHRRCQLKDEEMMTLKGPEIPFDLLFTIKVLLSAE
jgi:hypothetical protein